MNRRSMQARWGKLVAGILICTAGLYGCYQDDILTRLEETGQTQPRSLSTSYTRLDSVAMSDELWEFKAAADALNERYAPLFRQLSEEDWQELEQHIDDEAYLSAFLAGVNVEAEKQRLKHAQEALLRNTPIQQLSAEEKNQLYAMLAESDSQQIVPQVKTRGEYEEKMEECKKARDEAYKLAREMYYKNNVINKEQALILLQRDIRQADKSYKECINSL